MKPHSVRSLVFLVVLAAAIAALLLCRGQLGRLAGGDAAAGTPQDSLFGPGTFIRGAQLGSAAVLSDSAAELSLSGRPELRVLLVRANGEDTKDEEFQIQIVKVERVGRVMQEVTWSDPVIVYSPSEAELTELLRGGVPPHLNAWFSTAAASVRWNPPAGPTTPVWYLDPCPDGRGAEPD